MTDVYRWAVVDGTDGWLVYVGTDEEKARDVHKRIGGDRCNYRVARFKLVECAEGEGE